MDTVSKREKISTRITDLIYIILLAVMSAGLTEFFHRQTIRYNGRYISDTIVYAQNIGDVEKSRMIAWVFGKLNALDGSYYAISLFMSFMVAATVIAGFFFVSYIVHRNNCNVERWKLQLASFCVLFSGPIYIPVLHPHFYSGTWPKYAWHSPTEIAMVLFAIISIQLFIMIYDNYFESISFWKWIALVITVFLSAWAKPNFMLAFTPVVIVVLVADFFRKRNYGTWHTIKRIVMLGSAMIPAGIFVLILNSLEFSGDREDGGVEINVGYFMHQLDYPVVSILCSLAFALLVFAFNCKKVRDITYQVTAGVFIAGTAEYLMLVEAGTRINHGNFGWGRQIGEYLLFAYAIAIFIVNIKEQEYLSDRPILKKTYITVAGLLLLAHVLSQLVYVMYLLKGNLYRV